MLDPCVSLDSYHAGVILAMLERERMVLMMSKPSSVAPKFYAINTCFEFWLKEGEKYLESLPTLP